MPDDVSGERFTTYKRGGERRVAALCRSTACCSRSVIAFSSAMATRSSLSWATTAGSSTKPVSFILMSMSAICMYPLSCFSKSFMFALRSSEVVNVSQLGVFRQMALRLEAWAIGGGFSGRVGAHSTREPLLFGSSLRGAPYTGTWTRGSCAAQFSAGMSVFSRFLHGRTNRRHRWRQLVVRSAPPHGSGGRGPWGYSRHTGLGTRGTWLADGSPA